MFRKQRISLLLVVCGLLVVIGTCLMADWYHVSSSPELQFTSEASISCNIDGYTFTHTRETYTDGVVYQDGWWRRPLDPKVEMTAEAHGAGWASVLFYGNINDTKYGDDTSPEPAEQLGSWVGFLPFGAGLDHTVSVDFIGSFNGSPKTYKWDASGSIKLVPVYWKWSLNLAVPTGSWEEASSIHYDHSTASGGGSWLVERNWTTLNRASPGSGSGSGSDSGNTGGNTDDTSNCSDCTSHCSSPCSCSTSGTCDGTVTDNTPDCSYCTEGCSSCSSSDDSSSSLVRCPAAACGAMYDPNSSEAAQHTVQTFACGVHSGRACVNPWLDAHSTPRTCVRCGTTFYSCNRSGPCVSSLGTFANHTKGPN